MALSSGIVKRPGSQKFYARARVPDDLRGALGKTELWASLGTADPREAKALGMRRLAEWHDLFQRLRARSEPTEAEVREMVWARYMALVEQDEAARLTYPEDSDLDGVWRLLAKEYGQYDLEAYKLFELIRDGAKLDREERAARHAQLKAEVARGHSPSSLPVAHKAALEAGIGLDPTSTAARKLSGAFARAELEALRRAAERDEGEWGGAPADPIIRAPSSPATAAPAGTSLLELFEVYASEKQGGKTADTWRMERSVITRFAQFVGPHINVATIGKKHVRDFKTALAKWPNKADQVAEFRGRSFSEIIKLNEKVGRAPISARSINKYLSALSAFCNWLVANDYMPSQPVQGLFLEKPKDKKRLPFTVDQMQALFTSPLFTGFARDGREHEKGNERADDWRYWLPLMAAFTGARLGELAQLLVSDVREEHGIWFLHLTEEGSDEKSLKTAGSARVVPVHPELVKLGFLKFHAKAKASGEKRLFPTLKADARGFVSGRASKFFGTYMRKIGLKDDLTLNVHSFRHAVADALRRAGYLDEQFGPLLGHTRSTTTGRYGIMQQGPLMERARMIEAIAYPGLSLTHLRQENPPGY